MLSVRLHCQRDIWVWTFDGHCDLLATCNWINSLLDIQCNFTFYLCLEVLDFLQCSSFFPQLSFFPIFSFHCVVLHMCLYTDFSLLPFHTAFYLLFPQVHVSLHPPPCSHTHSIFKSKDSPCVMQAVSPPPLILSPSPFLVSSAPPPPQNVWIDLNGVIVTALPAVCPSTSASQRLWKVWREQRERMKGKGRERGRERGESSFEQQGMAALQRAKSSVRSQSQLQPVPLSLPLFIYSQSFFLSFSHTVFLNNLFPAEHPIFNLLSTISHFELTLRLLFLPLNLALSTLTCSFLSWSSIGGGWGGGVCWLHRRDKTSKSRPLIYPGGVALHLRGFMVVSHVVAFKEPGFKNVGHLK